MIAAQFSEDLLRLVGVDKLTYVLRRLQLFRQAHLPERVGEIRDCFLLVCTLQTF